MNTKVKDSLQKKDIKTKVNAMETLSQWVDETRMDIIGRDVLGMSYMK